MKRFIALLMGLTSACLASSAWPGPLEEVAQISAGRSQAFREGNAEAYVAAFADNGVLQSSFSPFRIEGRDAIKAYAAELFRAYPRRTLFIRQPSARA